MRAERNIKELPLQRISDQAEIPLSFSQQRIWLLAQFEPESLAYNIFKAIRLRGPLNLAALERSIQTIVRRHESLRTTVVTKNRKLIQVIAPPPSLTLHVTDLSELETVDREHETQRLIAEQSQYHFDLTRGPLFVARLLRLQEDEHVFLLALHHIIADGWSLGIFINEIATLYEGFLQAKPSLLPELPIQYKDFAVWQREWLQGDVLDQQLSYWKRQLTGAPPEVTLPADRPRPAVQTSHGAVQTHSLPNDISAGLKALSRQEGATLFMVMLAMMKVLLFKWTGQADLVVGTVVANRNRFEAEQLIGCFINFLPLRSILSAGQTGRELLEQVKTTILEACSYEDCPFDKIVEVVSPAKRLGRPIYNVAFFMQNTPFAQTPRLGDALELSVCSEETGSAPLDLRFMAFDSDGELVLRCEYSTDLFEAQTMEYLVESYVNILEQFIENADLKLADFKITNQLAARALAVQSADAQQTIAIAATFTAELVEPSINFWMEKLDFASSLVFAPYNQVFHQLLDPSSLLSRNRQGINVVLIRFEDWQRFLPQQPSVSFTETQLKIRDNVAQFLGALESAARHSVTPFIVCLCPASPAAVADSNQAALYRELEELVVSELDPLTNVQALTSTELLNAYPVAAYHNAYADELGHVPYSQAFFTSLGSTIARKINALKSAPYKVIALDCDHTLWNGVCGEDGIQGIEIDAGRRFLQEFMVAQHAVGKLLCLCSRNNEEDVFAVMEHYPEMPLKRDHLVSWRINWGPKSENLRSLADELNLGLDSFILIDDDPLECAKVQAHCPEVLTLQLPSEPHKIEKFLKHVWAFDHVKVTAEDKRRTDFYRRNIQSARLRNEVSTFADFLEALNLEVRTSIVRHEQLDRVSQLMQRTNQFNLTGVKRSESEIQQLCASGIYECLVTEVSDRFGDYGLVGVMAFAVEPAALKVDAYMLSCRALGRGVEHRMLASLGEKAAERGRDWVLIPFVRTQKNQPAFDFLNGLGGQFREPMAGGFLFRIPVTYIETLASQTSLIA